MPPPLPPPSPSPLSAVVGRMWAQVTEYVGVSDRKHVGASDREHVGASDGATDSSGLRLTFTTHRNLDLNSFKFIPH